MLVPDAAAARRMRRLVCGEGARGGVLAGVPRELIDAASRAYLPAFQPGNWSEQFRRALGELNAFWSASFEVAPDETSIVVESAYSDLLHAVLPGELPPPSDASAFSKRLRQRYTDFHRLNAALAGTLPDELAVIQAVFATDADDALFRLQVEYLPGFPRLTPALERLLTRLNQDAGMPGDPELAAMLDQLADDAGSARPRSTLGAVQRGLYRDSTQAPPRKDDSVQWIGCRDFLEEAEIAVGCAQSLLGEHEELTPPQIGLMIPDDYPHALAVAEVFGLAGLPLAGLPTEHWRRDLGREAVLLFLQCRQKPAPAMALAALLDSPLMPWPRKTGAGLAQAVMDGDYRLRPPTDADAETRRMLELISGGDETPRTLAAALAEFGGLLRASPELDAHVGLARAAVAELTRVIDSMPGLDWSALRKGVIPHYLPDETSPDFNLEGITVWRESQEPWREVEHLLVLGFQEGRYPGATGRASVFTDDEIAELEQMTGLELPTRAMQLADRRARFRRQLATVSGSAMFLVPRRSPDGSTVGPSESLVFMASVLGVADKAAELVMDLDDPAQRAVLRHLALAPGEKAVPPRQPDCTDLTLKADLLAIRTNAKGEPRPESPSGLETLMVSPLAWVLRRLGAEPSGWAPEAPDVLLLGSLAHGVFEDIFAAGDELPAKRGLAGRVEKAVERRITEMAPFMRGAQWKVERSNLAGSLSRAVNAWRDTLERLDARVVAGEAWLRGEFCGVPIHGQADVVIALSDGRLLVVDYKRSSSGARRRQMQAGFDSQATLYRIMLESGDENAVEPLLADALSATDDIGIVYYMLNDQTALADAALAGSASIPGWETLDAAVSAGAIALIERRLQQVRRGRIALNGSEDEAYFEKEASVRPYALDVSPLVRYFMRDGESKGLR